MYIYINTRIDLTPVPLSPPGVRQGPGIVWQCHGFGKRANPPS